MRKNTTSLTFIAAAILAFASFGFGQTPEEKVAETITALDAKFWAAYNKCDNAAFPAMFTDDVEFYHDKGGTTLGLENFMGELRTGLCGDPNLRLRREAVPGTVKVFPMAKNGTLYGAIISGEHVFYVNQKGKPEFLDGHARFMQLWLLQRDGVWKMGRILSYDHGPASRLKK